MMDYIVYFKPLLTGTRIIIRLFGIFWLVFGLLWLVGGILMRFYFTPMRRFQLRCMYEKEFLGCFQIPKPLCEWQEAVTTEMILWALTSNESFYFCNGDAIFRWQPHMAQEKKLWESLLTVKIERGFFHAKIGKHILTSMLKSYQYAPRLRLAHVKYIGKNCYELRAEIMDESLLFRFLECPTFRKNYQFAIILEAWRQEIQSCELRIDKKFDPALWHSILAFIAFPKGIDSSLISRHMRIPYR